MINFVYLSIPGKKLGAQPPSRTYVPVVVVVHLYRTGMPGKLPVWRRGLFVPAPIGCIGLRDICAQEGQAETGQHADERGIDIGPLERTALQQPVP